MRIEMVRKGEAQKLHIPGTAEDGGIRVRSGHAQILRIKGLPGPVCWALSMCGGKRMFFAPLPESGDLLDLIQKVQEAEWIPDESHSGLVIPVVNGGGIRMEVQPFSVMEGENDLRLSPPLLFWVEEEMPTAVGKILRRHPT